MYGKARAKFNGRKVSGFVQRPDEVEPAAVMVFSRREPPVVIDLTVFRRINTEGRQQRQKGRREGFRTCCDKISAAITGTLAGIPKRRAAVDLSSGCAVARISPFSKRSHRFAVAHFGC